MLANNLETKYSSSMIKANKFDDKASRSLDKRR